MQPNKKIQMKNATMELQEVPLGTDSIVHLNTLHSTAVLGCVPITQSSSVSSIR